MNYFVQTVKTKNPDSLNSLCFIVIVALTDENLLESSIFKDKISQVKMAKGFKRQRESPLIPPGESGT